MKRLYPNVHLNKETILYPNEKTIPNHNYPTEKSTCILYSNEKAVPNCKYIPNGTLIE